MSAILVNGRPADTVPADDRGLLYGDHLFETIAFHDGRAPLWDYHWRRLADGCERLALTPPEPDVVLDECRRISAGTKRGVVRVTLTRGSGGRAYEPPADPECRRIVMSRPWPEDVERQRSAGLSMVISSVLLSRGSMLAGLKHGNRLEQVMAALECRQLGADEAFMLDTQGRLIEAVSSNVVVVIGGRAFTPSIETAGVAGVGLAWLLDQPECKVETVVLEAGDLGRAEEVMVINSVSGIRPVTRIDGRRLDVGQRTREWQPLWNARIEG